MTSEQTWSFNSADIYEIDGTNCTCNVSPHPNTSLSAPDSTTINGSVYSEFTDGDESSLTYNTENWTEGCGCLCYIPYNSISVYIMGFAATPVIIFGLLSNIISIMIFTHKAMRHSLVNWYLTGRSMTDFLLLLTSFFLFCLPRLGDWFHNVHAINASYYTVPITYGLVMTAQTASNYLTVLMTAHRFIGVSVPFKAANILSAGRVKVALAAFLIFSVTFNITRFMEVKIVDFCMAPNIRRNIYQIAPTNLRAHNSMYKLLMFGWFYTIIMFLIPFSALIIMNSIVIHAVHATRKRHELIHQSDDVAKRMEAKKERSTSIMLVAVVVVFLACNILSLVLNVAEVSGIINPHGAAFSVMVDISNLLVAVSCSTNVFVYTSFSEKYRILLKYYLSCQWLREGEMLLSTLMTTC